MVGTRSSFITFLLASCSTAWSMSKETRVSSQLLRCHKVTVTFLVGTALDPKSSLLLSPLLPNLYASSVCFHVPPQCLPSLPLLPKVFNIVVIIASVEAFRELTEGRCSESNK